MAIAVATPGVLSVVDSRQWGVVVARAAYGIAFIWWNRPAATFWCTTILILVSELTLSAFGYSSGEWAFIPLMGAAFVVGLRGNRHRQLVGVASFIGVVAFAVAINVLTATPDRRVGLSPVVTIGLIGVSWLIGRETQRVRLQVEFAEGSLKQATFDFHEREQNAVAAERLRIAHDVHDLASHSLSALVIRTELAHLRVGAADQQLANEIRSIGDDGRRAMDELRAMLKVVHPPQLGTDPSGHNSSGVSLHDTFRTEVDTPGRSNSVSMTLSEEFLCVPSDVADAAQRFVREALMNANRYAPLTPVKVSAHRLDGSIVVTVSNGPPDEVTSGLVPTAPQGNPLGSGLGLALTRERLARCGGALTASPTSDGGFTAIATLPWRQ